MENMESSIQQSPSFLMIWDDITHGEGFSETWTQFNGEHAIVMGLLCCIRTSSSYSQLSQVVRFPQNFLTRDVVILISLPGDTAKVVIEILFMAPCYCPPVHN